MAKEKIPKGRRVKCHFTGEVGSSLAFYKAPDGFYYKSESIYQEKLHKAAVHKQLLCAIADVMMFDSSMAFPTIILKKLKELSFYGDDIILATLEQCRDSIGYAMRTKEFASEYNRAAYVMAILKNHINDVYKASKSDSVQKAKQAAKDVQPPAVDTYDFFSAPAAHKHTDLSSLFDDD